MQDWRGRRLLLEIANLQSTFDNSWCGGIAQLVERQLCKLEVRGSNPLASKALRAWRQSLTGRGTTFGWMGINPLASSPESFRDCRAVALAKADIFRPVRRTQRATIRQAKPFIDL